MTKHAALGLAAGGVALAVAAVVLLLGGEPDGEALPARTPAPGTPAHAVPRPTAPPSAPTPPAPGPPRPAPDGQPTGEGTRPSPAADGPPVRDLEGEALAARVAAIVARGEGAESQRDEMAAARDLEALLSDVAARGEAGLREALALLGPGRAPGVQEVGCRLLGRLGGQAATDRLADVSRDRAAPPPVRLQALQALQRVAGPYAQGLIADLAQATDEELGLRAFAMDQLGEPGASVLEDIALDPGDSLDARLAALVALNGVSPARAQEVSGKLAGDPEVAPHLEGLLD